MVMTVNIFKELARVLVMTVLYPENKVINNQHNLLIKPRALHTCIERV